MSIIALFIVALLNAGVFGPVLFEDEPIALVMGEVAMGALIEAQPQCDNSATRWDFNADNVGGLWVHGFADCEYAAEFYRSPETGLWQFTVEGS